MTAPHILVAEDDKALVALVARWLEAAGYVVRQASDGVAVIQAVQKAVPAAILMDVAMPRLDGFQVLVKFRELDLPRVPVLMMTGRNSAADVRKAAMLGAKDYLTKPVEREQLLARLDRMLRKFPPAPPSSSDVERQLDYYID